MSDSFSIEPPTTATVVFLTSKGSLRFNLWAKETPIACRNFIERSLEGYYNDSKFHRIIKDFIIQGGIGWRDNKDPDSNEKKGFPDEFNSRLKFNRIGIVGTANIEGVKNSNGSQFIITIGSQGAPQLNNKNTVFGKIDQESIYNLLAIGTEGEIIEGTDGEPLYPVKILKAEVPEPYFQDIKDKIARGDYNTQQNPGKEDAESMRIRKIKSLSGRKVKEKLKLSYENEEEEDVGPVLNKKEGFRMKLPSKAEKSKKKKKEEAKQKDLDIQEELSKSGNDAIKKSTTDENTKKSNTIEESEIGNYSIDIKSTTEGVSKFDNKIRENMEIKKDVKELSDEYELLKQQFKKRKRGDEKESYSTKEHKLTKTPDPSKTADDIYSVEKFKSKSKIPKSGDQREAETLAMLQKFKSKLSTNTLFTPDKNQNKASSNEGDKDLLEQAGSDLSEEEDEDPTSLYNHKFVANM